MAITSKNFCHIEEVENGIKVLFYVEHDGDDVILHQVTHCDIGTVDMTVKMLADKWENLWPDGVQFTNAAAELLKTVRTLDLVVS